MGVENRHFVVERDDNKIIGDYLPLCVDFCLLFHFRNILAPRIVRATTKMIETRPTKAMPSRAFEVRDPSLIGSANEHCNYVGSISILHSK